MKVLAIIPSRYNSSRFPGKPLANIMGKSMIQRVVEQCKKCEEIGRIIVATDDTRIFLHVQSFGAEVIMTSEYHENGSSRCSEVFSSINEEYDVILNIQGDEPYIKPEQISSLLSLFKSEDIEIGTLAKKITDYNIYRDANNPKIFFNKEKIATSFERQGSLNEYQFKQNKFYQHIGIYGFRSDTLSKIAKLDPTKNEIKENLEQCRWLDNQYKIKVKLTSLENIPIDREEDIEKIKTLNLKNS